MRETQHIDTRIIRTHRLLKEAFLKLAEEKDLDDIGITEICDTAMVHRATFYNHFEDKEDFIRYVVKSSIEQIITESKKQAETDDSRAFSDLLMLNFLSFATAHKRLIMGTISGGANGTYFYDSMYEFFRDELKRPLVPPVKETDDLEQYEHAFCHFITGGALSLTYWWLSGGCEYCTKEQLVEQIKATLQSLLDARF